MRVVITYALEVPSLQKAVALRDRLEEQITEDEDVSVVAKSASQGTFLYEVLGVDTDKDKAFRTQVEATDPEDAAERVAKGTKVVAGVRQVG